MYFIRGSLPWQGLKINRKEDRYKKICEKKKETSAKDLCTGFPKEFENFVSYTRNLQFTEVPNYEYLRNLLKTIIKKSGSEIDFFYDWCTSKPNIKPDDPIFTNDYKIQYNGAHEWLNTNINNNDLEEKGNHDDYQHNDNINNGINHNSYGMFNGHHHKAESTNLSTKCVIDMESKKNLPFMSLKKDI